MIRISRTGSTNKSFITLVQLLDAELAEIDGAEHSFYDQFNKLIDINTAVVVYDDDLPVGCGAFKEYDKNSVEIKRMYVVNGSRGKGIAALILSELEKWAIELSYKTSILETGKRQPAAIRLYTKNGYTPIRNFGPYEKDDNSCCFEKKLSPLPEI